MLNKAQSERIIEHLKNNENNLINFYSLKKSLLNILEIYKSTYNSDYVIEDRDEPLSLSFFNDASWRADNISRLLPLTTLKTLPEVHKSAHSIWALVNGDLEKIKNLHLIVLLSESEIEKLKATNPKDYTKLYNASITNEIKELASNWVKTRMMEFEAEKAKSLELNNHTEASSSIDELASSFSSIFLSNSPTSPALNSSILSTKSNSPESPTKVSFKEDFTNNALKESKSEKVKSEKLTGGQGLQ